MKWWSTITKKAWDEKTIIYHKLANDEGALAMMCGKDEEPEPSVVANWRIAMACARCMNMDTRQ
jgi:hypothetical protein